VEGDFIVKLVGSMLKGGWECNDYQDLLFWLKVEGMMIQSKSSGYAAVVLRAKRIQTA
jgi:hypothetical protein